MCVWPKKHILSSGPRFSLHKSSSCARETHALPSSSAHSRPVVCQESVICHPYKTGNTLQVCPREVDGLVICVTVGLWVMLPLLSVVRVHHEDIFDPCCSHSLAIGGRIGLGVLRAGWGFRMQCYVPASMFVHVGVYVCVCGMKTIC